jgi:hypothetical protein
MKSISRGDRSRTYLSLVRSKRRVKGTKGVGENRMGLMNRRIVRCQSMGTGGKWQWNHLKVSE